ncbi:MAG TPA: TonB-dependent receptor [Steroidobacteraceae bacterium]|nr:TonB-dependent receptor [Steroidobacteraceae bacterium]
MNRLRPLAATSFFALTLPAIVSAADAPRPRAESSTTSTVLITGKRVASENYRVDSLDSLGPLGTTSLMDTPYSVAVLPGELIQNSQAANFKDVSKYLPLVAYQEQQGPDILRPQTRGMQGGNFQNSRLDGMTMYVTVANAMEQFQQIEVVNGVSASLYGPANPSGMFNFISKRPTDEDLRQVGVSYTSDSIATAKADISGGLDSRGIFSYRLNGVYGKGDGYVDGSHQRRALADVALDIRPWEHSVLELNYSDYELNNKGFPGWFAYGQAIQIPDAPNPNRAGYGQTYAGVDMKTQIATARVKHDFSSDWHLVVGVLNQDATRDINTPVNVLSNNTGTYVSSFANGFAPRFKITSDSAYLNGRFDTGSVSHDLTIGSAGYKSQAYAVTTPATAASVRLGTATLSAPLSFPEPAAGPPNVRLNFNSSNIYQQGINVGDTLRFTEQWSIRLALSQDWFHTDNFNAAGTALAGYKDHGVSPMGSVIFKPASNVTLYATYGSSLQAGDVAPGTAANAGVGLAPYRSTEFELGYKWALEKLNLTAALFRVERPFANTDPADRIFKISGDQVNEGLELSAIGEVFQGLTVYGGVTFLDARMQDTPLLTTNDKRYVGAAKVKGNLLLEYQIPAIPGLVTSVNYQFSGRRAANDTNSQFAPGYNLFDLGLRYDMTVRDTPVALRLAVNNITDRHYWSTLAPSNITGTNTGNLLAHLGTPRTVLASVSVDF